MPELVAGRYELVREVGRGASATVHRAYDRTLDRYIAIKLVSAALANDPDFVDRFLREARLAAGLNHPNIVTVHDAGETDDGRPFLAMELVEGDSLEEVISEHAPLPTSQAMRILGDITGALEYLHGQGLVHRDVKPSNILIAESGRVVLSDFGIAYARESARYTNTGVMLGTPRYMAPEQFKGEAPTPATDVYALGVIAFELLSGAPPFDGTGTALMYRIVHEPPPPVTSFAPHVTPGVEAVIAKALAKEPDDRWSTPAEFLAALTSPDADATMLGDSALVVPGAAVLAEVEAPPVEDGAAVLGESPGPVEAEPTAEYGTVPGPLAGGVGGGRRGGRVKAMAGAFGAGVIGIGLAGYCMATGGILPAASDDDEEPTLAVAATAETPSDDDGASPSPTRRPTRTPTPPTVATVTATIQVATPDPTQPPPPAATSTPTATNTATPIATPIPAPPLAPSDVVLNDNTLSWSDNSNNEEGFRIYWRAQDLNSGTWLGENDETVGANTTSTTVDTVFLIGTTADFQRGVSAYNSAGESAIAWE